MLTAIAVTNRNRLIILCDAHPVTLLTAVDGMKQPFFLNELTVSPL
jgi:hypothetical protein